MDLLFKRYANPFPFLDGMIQAGRFFDFVIAFDITIYKEKDEETLWNFYLHRVFDKSFVDFKTEIEVEQKNRHLSVSAIQTTIQKTKNILDNFNPEEGGNENRSF